MSWVNSPELFCDTSKTVSDNMNIYALDPKSIFTVYPPTVRAYKNASGATASPDCLKYVDVYMGDLLCAAQGDPTQQHRVSEITICALMDILPYLPSEVKESTISKKSLARDRDWAEIKEILGWMIDTDDLGS